MQTVSSTWKRRGYCARSAGFAPVSAGDHAPRREPAEDRVAEGDDRDDDQDRRVVEEVADRAEQPTSAANRTSSQSVRQRFARICSLRVMRGAKLTFTGSRWSVSKNSRSLKPSGPAMSTAGKLCLTVL